MSHHRRQRRHTPALSGKRRAILEAYRHEWLAIMRSTVPADRDAAEAGVRNAYEAADLKPPATYLWFDSPLSAVLASEIITGEIYVNEILPAQGFPVDPRDVLAAVKAAGVRRQYSSDPASQQLVRAAADANDFNLGPWWPYLHGLEAVAWEQIWRQVDVHQSELLTRNFLWGRTSHSASTFSWKWRSPFGIDITSLAALQAVGYDTEPVAAGLVQAARQAHCWIGLNDVAILCDRPQRVDTDAVYTLTFRDGFSVQAPELLQPSAVVPAQPRQEPRWRRPVCGLRELPPHRRAVINDFVAQWHTDITGNAPVDHAATEEHIRGVYRTEGLAPPETVLWFDSPLAGAIAQSILWMHGQRVISSWPRTWQQADESIRKRCYRRFPERLRNWLESPAVAPLWEIQSSVDAAVRATITRPHTPFWQQWTPEQIPVPQIWAQAADTVHAHLGYQVLPSPPAMVDAHPIHCAAWDCGAPPHWRSRADFSMEGRLAVAAPLTAMGIDIPAIKDHIALARTASWWWPLHNVAIATERPEQIITDDRGRLHNPDGPAITYRDGFSIYAWRNTPVPADLIENGWDVPRIIAERNTEIRRCAIERLGWDIFLDELGGKPIASALDPGNPGFTLDLYDFPEQLLNVGQQRGPRRVLLCTNGSVERDGTRRRYGLLVPSRHTDPVEAAAELYGIPTDIYRHLEVRR